MLCDAIIGVIVVGIMVYNYIFCMIVSEILKNYSVRYI